MAKTGVDLISTADIARLADQSRATVGNWKARNPDFPPERGRGPRGPLYDRGEVTQWLQSTGRLDKQPPEVSAMWHVVGLLRGHMATEDALPLVLVLLAVMALADTAPWREIVQARPEELDATIRSAVFPLFPFADELVPRRPLPAEPVARVIAALSNLDQPRIWLMAGALPEHAAKTMGHRGGEYLSPPSVRRLVVAIAELVGSVYNPVESVYIPGSGIGQLMIDVAVRGGRGDLELTGQEINPRIWAMAQLNLAIEGVHADIALGDVFTDDRFPQLRADRVVAIPQWNQKLPVLDRMNGDPRWVWGEPGPNDVSAAWIQHCLYHLAESGRAVVVLPNAALFEGGRAGRIRQRIIKAGLLDAVVALPPGLFAWTNLPCAVLVFVKGRGSADGKPAPTLMVDIRDPAEGRTAHPAHPALGDALIGEVTRICRGWAAGEEPTSENAAVAHFDDLAANDFVIDPARYVSVPYPAPDLEEAVQKRAALLDHLDRLTQASRDADDQLRAILGCGDD